MKQYNIRELYRHLSKALKELPFQITYHNKVIATVVPGEIDNLLETLENKNRELIKENQKLIAFGKQEYPKPKKNIQKNKKDNGIYSVSEAEIGNKEYTKALKEMNNRIDSNKLDLKPIKNIKEAKKAIKPTGDLCEHGFPKGLCKKCMFKK